MTAELLRSGDKRRAKLDQLRDRKASVEQKIEALDNAPLEVEEIVQAYLNATDEPHAQARLVFEQRCHPRGHGPLPPLEWGMFRFVLGDEQFTSLLRARIAEVHPGGAVPLSERQQQRNSLMDELEGLCEQEEDELMALESRGLFAERMRPRDANDIDRVLRAWSG